MTSEVSHCLKRFASGLRLVRIRDHRPDSLMMVTFRRCVMPFELVSVMPTSAVTEEETQLIDAWAARYGVTRAEAIRRLVQKGRRVMMQLLGGNDEQFERQKPTKVFI